MNDQDWHSLVNLENSIGYQLREADRAAEAALASLLNKHDIPIGMWFYLRILWQHNGINQSELCRRVNATSATTAVQLNKMEQRGLIRREETKGDKRQLRVYLTELGINIEDVLMPEALRHRQRLLEGISAEEISVTMDTLRRIRKNARELSNDDLR